MWRIQTHPLHLQQDTRFHPSAAAILYNGIYYYLLRWSHRHLPGLIEKARKIYLHSCTVIYFYIVQFLKERLTNRYETDASYYQFMQLSCFSLLLDYSCKMFILVSVNIIFSRIPNFKFIESCTFNNS